MALQEIDSKVGELALGNSETVVCSQNPQLPVLVKKTPLRDLQSETNIVAQKGSSNPIVLKETVVSESTKVSGVKRPPDTPMSPHQQSSSNSGANNHLVYVRRKSEAETIKINNNEATADNAESPQPSHIGDKGEGTQPKSLISEPQMQTLPSSIMRNPSDEPPLSLGNHNTKTSSVELKTEAAPSAIILPDEMKVKKRNWEDRYVQLQMYLKRVDESNLEDHLQMLRSLSAAELSRHAVLLEKRAIQLSLEQGKELQRVKALNVLGKPMKPASGPPGQQQTPQC